MILVTGATGNIGQNLVSLLASKGVQSRAISRHPEKLGQVPKSIELIVGDLREPASIRRIFAGADLLFLLPMFGEADSNVIDEAKRAGVRRVVMISTVAPEDTIIGARHHETENRLKDSGLAHTILRAGAFMSNALEWAGSIKNQCAVYTPIPDAEITPIAPRDIAAAAEVALLAPAATDEVVEITGAKALTTRAQVRILSEVLGRTIECVEISISDMAGRMKSRGDPDWVIDAVSEQMGRIRDGRPPLLTQQFEQIVHRPPLSFKDWCIENRHAF